MNTNPPSLIADIFRRHRFALALTYSLSALENLLDLLYPLMIGIAIDGLLDGTAASLLPITLTWIVHALLSAGRQLYDARISILVLLPMFLINMLHRRTTRDLNTGLNDELEREIEIIETRESDRIGEHFGKLSRWYIRLSDADVRTWLVMQPFMIGLVVLVLVRSVGMGMEPGDIFASVLYMLRFSDSWIRFRSLSSSTAGCRILLSV